MILVTLVIFFLRICFISFVSLHPGAEGHQRQLGDLEKLLAEGDPDDRDAPKDPEQQILQRHGDSEAEQPDDIGQEGRRAAAIHDFLPEGPAGEAREFEALPAEGNADHRDAAGEPGEQPGEPAEKAAEQEP